MKPSPTPLSRRDFLRLTAAATAGLAWWTLPGWLHAAASLAPSSRKKTLVVLFQRGAADGLNIVVPFSDPFYRKARPTIHLGEPGADRGVLDLDGRFGLHPRLSPLMPLWKEGRFAVVHAVGSPEETRSHFDAQDNMETGTPGIAGTPDGWLNRALSTLPPAGSDPLSAVALSDRLPRILRGDYPVAAIPNAENYEFAMGSQGPEVIESLYGGSMDGLLAGAGRQAGESVKRLRDLLKDVPPGADAAYSQSGLGRSLRDMARLIKAGAGLRVGFLDVGGWDNHYEEGSTEGYLGTALGDLGQNLAAFFSDLDEKARDVTLVTLTEFGRALNENGARGTDHGHGSVMFLIGGPVKGGKVYGRWPGLEPENLFENRDLQVTTDFRTVFAEVLRKHLGLSAQQAVFPGFTPDLPLGLL